MKEVSFKYIFILVLINIFCFTESINPNSYSFIFNNFTPDSNYKNNIGLQFAFKDNYKSFQTQNWISDNLYLGGMFNLRNNNIKLNYSLNVGYKVLVSIGIWILMTILCYWFGKFMASGDRHWN